MPHESRRILVNLPRSFWIGLATLLVAGLGYIFWNDLKSERRNREDEKRASYGLKCGIFGLWNYTDAHGCLPKAVLSDDGRPRASWRFLIWNYIEATNWSILDKEKPWIRPDKTEIDVRTVAGMASPFSFWETSAQGATRIAAIAGPDSAFDEQNRCSFAQLDDDTIILVEVADSDVRWTEPGDFAWEGELPDSAHNGSMKIGNTNGRAFHIAFQDGDVWALSADTPLADLSRFFTVRGARENDRETILGRWRR